AGFSSRGAPPSLDRMRDSLRLLPGGRRLLVLAVPVLLGVGLVAGAFLYAAAASPAAVQPEVAGPDLGVPPPAGLLIDVIGAVDRPGDRKSTRLNSSHR